MSRDCRVKWKGIRLSLLLLLWAALSCCDREVGRQFEPSIEPARPDPAAVSVEAGPQLAPQLAAALAAKGDGYIPRTKHKAADGTPRYTNRLILQSSPYLLQHAHNPVSWFPWGDEAFALARALGRPVFLSVGYSTCHWCHVMEEESFEDEEIARYINEHYVPIKVDREARPDVDAVYMAAVQMLTGRGGWPMSVWLTPDRKPFFGGTYFPPRDGVRGVRRGFLTLLREQSDRFKANPGSVAEEAQALADRIREARAVRAASGLPSASVLGRAVAFATRRYDPEWGGARGAPKFPSSFPVRLLLRHHRSHDASESLNMSTETLRKMAAGGMYDHVGGGFHRYSVDARWLVPHFEKMLYDNALLVIAYLEGFQVTGDADFARVARETLDYVLREMTSQQGAFYSATDADSVAPNGHREEGYYFTWTPRELKAALGGERARVAESYYAVSAQGNFEGCSILHTPHSRRDSAERLSLSLPQLDEQIAQARQLLLQVRNRRPPPLRDDKVQASWNGLMISAFAKAAQVLGEPRYAAAAARAASFLRDKLWSGGRMRHSITSGKVSLEGFLQDYAFFAAGLIDLFETTHEAHWLELALALMEALEKHHGDSANGGYFMTSHDHEQLLARDKPHYDGAVPAGNSVALMNQLRLAELTTAELWRQRAETTQRAFSHSLESRPHALAEMMLAVDFAQAVALQVVIVLPDGGDDGGGLQSVLRSELAANRVALVARATELDGRLGQLVPWARGKPARGGKATAYVCERGACDLPTTDAGVFRRQLRKKRTKGR